MGSILKRYEAVLKGDAESLHFKVESYYDQFRITRFDEKAFFSKWKEVTTVNSMSNIRQEIRNLVGSELFVDVFEYGVNLEPFSSPSNYRPQKFEVVLRNNSRKRYFKVKSDSRGYQILEYDSKALFNNWDSIGSTIMCKEGIKAKIRSIVGNEFSTMNEYDYDKTP